MPKTHAQHGRDHCPGGADPIPCLAGAWVRRRYTGSTIVCPSLNDVVVTYNDGGDPESGEVQGSTDWRDYFDLFSTSQIEVLRAGHYTLSGKFMWVSWSGNYDSYIVLNDGGVNPEIVSYVKPINEINVTNQAFTFCHRYVAHETMLITMAQGSGSNQTLANGYFEIRYDGAYSGPDSNDVDDPDPVE